MTNKVYVKKRMVDTTEKCWMPECNMPVEHYVIRTEDIKKIVCPVCQKHMLDTYKSACEYMFKHKKK